MSDHSVVLSNPGRRFAGVALSPVGFFLTVIGLYVATVYAISAASGLAHHFVLYGYSQAAIATVTTAGFFVLLSYTLQLALAEREKRPLRRLINDVRAYAPTNWDLADIVLPFIVLPFFIAAFTSFKSMLPSLNGFQFDPLFAEIDRMLHFGVDPWRITHALFGTPLATLILTFLYNVWFIAMWVFTIWQAIKIHHGPARMQYFIGFLFCWIVIGSIFAFTLSSAGPVYYEAVAGNSPYGPLVDRLHEIDTILEGWHPMLGVWALDAQQILWDAYSASRTHFGSGISAMPSMHVSIATLMALSAWQVNRRFGIVMTAYAAVIMIGSVHLAWHYAIDGYVSIILTLAIWFATGRLGRWLSAVRQKS